MRCKAVPPNFFQLATHFPTFTENFCGATIRYCGKQRAEVLIELELMMPIAYVVGEQGYILWKIL